MLTSVGTVVIYLKVSTLYPHIHIYIYIYISHELACTHFQCMSREVIKNVIIKKRSFKPPKESTHHASKKDSTVSSSQDLAIKSIQRSMKDSDLLVNSAVAQRYINLKKNARTSYMRDHGLKSGPKCRKKMKK